MGKITPKHFIGFNRWYLTCFFLNMLGKKENKEKLIINVPRAININARDRIELLRPRKNPLQNFKMMMMMANVEEVHKGCLVR